MSHHIMQTKISNTILNAFDFHSAQNTDESLFCSFALFCFIIFDLATFYQPDYFIWTLDLDIGLFDSILTLC